VLHVEAVGVKTDYMVIGVSRGWFRRGSILISRVSTVQEHREHKLVSGREHVRHQFWVTCSWEPAGRTVRIFSSEGELIAFLEGFRTASLLFKRRPLQIPRFPWARER